MEEIFAQHLLAPGMGMRGGEAFGAAFGFGGTGPGPTGGPEAPAEEPAVPPAGAKVLRTLPTVVVTAEDLMDESNRECCICLEDNNLGDRVKRLPCGHLFHPHCITTWLSKHCTCPTCRLELPTDDLRYETGRRERMAARRPRYRRWELDRMRIPELRALCQKHKLPCKDAVDKDDLIRAVVNSPQVDVVACPPPLEIRLSELRNMGVGDLKKMMTDGGVSFDPKDVVEKEDVVQIFVNSGRVHLIAEEEDLAEEPTQEEDSKKRTRIHEEEQGAPEDEEEGAKEEGAKEKKAEEEGAEEEGAMEEDRKCAPDACHSVTETEPMETQPTKPTKPTKPAAPRTTTTARPASRPSLDVLARELGSKSVPQLRRLAMGVDADIGGCVEKREIVERIAEAMVDGRDFKEICGR